MSRGGLALSRGFGGGVRVRRIRVVAQPLGSHLPKGPTVTVEDRVAAGLGLPLAASAEPLLHAASRRRLADVLTCLREGTDEVTVDPAIASRARRAVERMIEIGSGRDH